VNDGGENMPSRITQESMSRTTLSNIKLNFKKMQEIQEKMSSGKQINRPSDDPSGARKVLGLKTEILQIDQFVDNAKTAQQQMEYTSSALENIQEILSKVNELAIQASNDTLSQAERKIQARELDQMIESVLQFANMDNDGRFVFSGTKTFTVAFTATYTNGNISGVTYNGNNEEIKYQVGASSYVKTNLPGGAFFNDKKIFSNLISMRDALDASSFNASAFSSLRQDLATAIDAVSSEVTKFGAKQNRLEITVNRLEETKISMRELISNTEDIDVASLVMDLKNQENILQSSLQTGARVIQPTLLDFLR
jgi:flagellar hook-associated protein 3 FlgL